MRITRKKKVFTQYLCSDLEMSHVPIHIDIHMTLQSYTSSFLVALGMGSVMVKKCQLVGLLCLLFPNMGVQAAVTDTIYIVLRYVIYIHTAKVENNTYQSHA